jgi:hypothetical protein
VWQVAHETLSFRENIGTAFASHFAPFNISRIIVSDTPVKIKFKHLFILRLFDPVANSGLPNPKDLPTYPLPHHARQRLFDEEPSGARASSTAQTKVGWTAKKVAAWIEQKTGKRVHQTTAWRAMKAAGFLFRSRGHAINKRIRKRGK